MAPFKGDVPVCYNCAGPQADLNIYLKPYMDYFDFVGIDIYMGCFFFGTMWMFDALLRYLFIMTGKPIVLCEFGYIGGGAPKSKKEKLDIIKSYGAKSKKEAKKNIEAFIENMPETMRNYIKRCAQDPARYARYIFRSEFTITNASFPFLSAALISYSVASGFSGSGTSAVYLPVLALVCTVRDSASST